MSFIFFQMLLSIICHSYFCCENTWLQNTTNDGKFHLTFVIGHSSCLFLNDTCNQTWRHISYYWPCNKYMQYVKLSFSCFANMTPAIKIYMTYYDVICHLSWSCRMVYVFHLLLQTWQSQSTQTLLTTWHLSFINVFWCMERNQIWIAKCELLLTG